MKYYFLKVKFTAFCTTIFSVLSVVCLAAIPMLHKKLFDTAPGDWSGGQLLILFCLYGAAFFLCCVFEYFSQTTAWKLDWKIHIMFRGDLYNGIYKKTHQEFNQTGIGEYLSKFQNEVDVATAYMNSGINCIKYILQIVVYFTFIVTLDWRILLVITIGTVISLAVPKFTGKELSARKNLWIKNQGKYLDVIKDLFHGFGENNYKTAENLKEYHRKNLHETENSMLNFGKFSAFVHVVNGGVLYAINLLCFIIVGMLYFTRAITAGTGVAALGYVNSFIDPLRYLLEEISNMKASRGVVEELMNFIHSNSDECCSRSVNAHIEKIELVNVNKAYENFKLANVNAVFEKGKKYAVIGPNASGKSTLFKIISGMENPDSGEVLFDGVSVENSAVKDMVFIAGASSHIFHCSVKDNLTVFNSYQIKDKYNELFNELCTPQGRTKDGKEALALSGGEKQKIAFVRALLADFPVILYDEPFSAMDKENSHRFKKILTRLEDKILITITHDLTEENLQDFDIVIGIRDGRIEETGTPDEIINSGFYAEITK